MEATGLGHRYGPVVALAGVDLRVRVGSMVGVIGPDGVGKSTLLGLVAGARRIQQGRVTVLGRDLRSTGGRRAAAARIAYMPPGLGANLHAELTVEQNLAFFGRLFRLPRAERRRRASELLAATGLAGAADRRAGHLSGGMKQKLGLCCALIHEPELLVLDEPTTGVDPLSRRAFWQLVAGLRERRPGMGVLVATAYLREAESFDELLLLDGGRAVASGAVRELRARGGGATLEEAYGALVGRRPAIGAPRAPAPAGPPAEAELAIRARGLARSFGRVRAVDGVDFEVRRGEIFGFIGPNGSGKTTTMKMLTGILPPSAGEAWLLGQRVDASSLALRRRVGYMPQSFALDPELTPRESLVLHGRLFDLPRAELRLRIQEIARELALPDHLDARCASLPLGIRQRLGLALALLHRPDLLVLDEPTSGVDPIARDGFWQVLRRLSAASTTIFVSTHYLAEARRCHRIALMSRGRLLACDEPDAIVRGASAGDLEEAFARLIEADAGTPGSGGER